MQVLPRQRRITPAIVIEEKIMWLVTIEDKTNIIRRNPISAQTVIVTDEVHKKKTIITLEPFAWRVSSSPMRQYGLCCARDWKEVDAEHAAKRLRGRFFN